MCVSLALGRKYVRMFGWVFLVWCASVCVCVCKQQTMGGDTALTGHAFFHYSVYIGLCLVPWFLCDCAEVTPNVQLFPSCRYFFQGFHFIIYGTLVKCSFFGFYRPVKKKKQNNNLCSCDLECLSQLLHKLVEM